MASPVLLSTAPGPHSLVSRSHEPLSLCILYHRPALAVLLCWELVAQRLPEAPMPLLPVLIFISHQLCLRILLLNVSVICLFLPDSTTSTVLLQASPISWLKFHGSLLTGPPALNPHRKLFHLYVCQCALEATHSPTQTTLIARMSLLTLRGVHKICTPALSTLFCS